ncbi:MAG TPA: dTDP-4-dehydrorhamnose reductase [Candidatus Eisenbacteria bacterium]|nr:dTDP-4-dehydrorhamnose reductase [Candidatus Eisenbacteria bacterium]
MRVAVVGANGQLGCDVVWAFTASGDGVCALTHGDIEIAQPDSVAAKLGELQPDLVVNTAAMHNVEQCEREPERAFAVNALGARNLALAARGLGASLMHVSTDYVFDGRKSSPYLETDCPQPLNVYGNSKLAGEYFVCASLERHFVLRTSGLYGMAPCRAKGGRNFVDLMLKLADERDELRVVNNEFVTPTSTRELALQMVALSRSDAYGLYHATAEGSCSWHKFAREIMRIANKSVKLSVAGEDEFPAKVPRPKFSVLENGALKQRQLNTFGRWQDGLRDYLIATLSHAKAARR